MLRKTLLLAAAVCLVWLNKASALDLTVGSGQTYVITTNKAYNVIEVYGTLRIDSGDVTVAARSQIDGGHIIVNDGSLTILTSATRFDVGKGSGGAITMNGGLFRSDVEMKLPDDDGGTTTVTLNGGMLSTQAAQVYIDRGYHCVAGGGIFRIDGDVEGDGDRDPRQWLAQGALTPAAGYSLDDIAIEYVAAGDYTQVSTDPNARAQFALSASSDFETVSPALLEVTLSKALGDTVYVNYWASGGTADNGGIDYTLASGSLTFLAGQTSRNIEIPIVNDGFDEDDETIEVQLLSVTGDDIRLGGQTLHTYTIIDPRPFVSFESASQNGAETKTSVEIPVMLTWVSSGQVTVDYNVIGGTADGGGIDYTMLGNGTLTFDPCDVTETININVEDDGWDEENETIVLQLSAPSSNARLGSITEHTYTIGENFFESFADSETIGLWLFDEADYPHTTLTDASEYEKADLCLMDGGNMVMGRYGNALEFSGSDYALTYAGFAGKVPEEELREPDGTPSGLWGPTEGSGPLFNGLAGNTWTIELWLNLSSAPNGSFIIDMGWAYDPGLSLTLTGGSLVLTNYYAGVQATCPTGVLTSGWHHITFTWDGSTVRHFYDGVEQSAPAVISVTVQPIPDLQVPSDREHEHRGFNSMSYEVRRQNRFNFAVGSDRHAANIAVGKIDEMRISRIVQYSANFTPQSFSRNYGAGAPAPSIANGPALLFNPGPVSIPVQLGARKHVFIDDEIVDTMSSLQITMNQPYDKQEIIKDFTIAKSAWRPSVYDVDGAVYMAIPEGYSGSTGTTYLATSSDGLNFTMQNPIILDAPMYGSFFKDLNPDVHPQEQYKVNAFVGNRGMYMYVSPDGVNWRRNETIQLALRSGGEGECFWDDQRGRYASYIKRDSSFDDPECANANGRVGVGFWSDEILKAWPFYHMVTPYFEGYPFPSVTCEGPVEFDSTGAGEVYRTRAIKYPWAADMYLSFLWRYGGDDGPRHVDLGISRDGENWSFFGTNWYIPLGAAQEELSLYGLVRRGGEIWQYVDEGGAHGGDDPRTYYRYKQRLDGFVSLDAAGSIGTMTTLPLVFNGKELTLNVNATGYMKVGLLDEYSVAIPGFGLADCDPIVIDSVEHVVTWGGESQVEDYCGQTVRLQFEMQNAKLYAFEFTCNATRGDVDGDCDVGFKDLGKLASKWLTSCIGPVWCDDSDINEDNIVNGKDFAILAGDWGQNCE